MTREKVCSACGRLIEDEELRVVVSFYSPESDLESPVVICTECLVTLSVHPKVATYERAMGS